MRLIKPSIEVPQLDGVKLMKNIEKAGRTCYKSEGSITEDSYKNFIKNCVNRGHESVLEHEKVTAILTCDVGAYKDLTRHRIASFSIESTRYCAYDKDKFGNEIACIEPMFMDDDVKFGIWKKCMEYIENSYMELRNVEATPDVCRMILSHSTAASVTITANMREWRHIFELRASSHAHPSVQQLMIPLLLHFKNEMPELFDTVEYNREVEPQKYAKVNVVD